METIQKPPTTILVLEPHEKRHGRLKQKLGPLLPGYQVKFLYWMYGMDRRDQDETVGLIILSTTPKHQESDVRGAMDFLVETHPRARMILIIGRDQAFDAPALTRLNRYPRTRTLIATIKKLLPQPES